MGAFAALTCLLLVVIGGPKPYRSFAFNHLCPTGDPVVDGKRIERMPSMAAVQIVTGRAERVVRPRRPGTRYFVRVRYCFTSCEFMEVETSERGYDLASPDRLWSPSWAETTPDPAHPP